ncbi:hypothetical protein WMY93_024446 [Mugilogobius chulae]|uniref:Uncharacterized protein n=1 Tax=Mugilogobius chulae TaxID=88201 RepID=A0AAW0N6F6_9GOBI
MRPGTPSKPACPATHRGSSSRVSGVSHGPCACERVVVIKRLSPAGTDTQMDTFDTLCCGGSIRLNMELIQASAGQIDTGSTAPAGVRIRTKHGAHTGLLLVSESGLNMELIQASVSDRTHTGSCWCQSQTKHGATRASCW